MKRLTSIMLLVLCIGACVENRSDDDWATIRETCSIEAYQEYLIENSRSIYLNEIVDSLKVFWEKENFKRVVESGNTDCYGNCLALVVMKDNQILFVDQVIKREKLKEVIKYSIMNPDYLPNLPEKEAITIPPVGEVLKSKGFIDIISEVGFDKEIYSEIIEIVKSVFFEIRNENAIAIYNTTYENLNNQEKEIIEQIVPLNIRFERMGFSELVEPLPPKFDN